MTAPYDFANLLIVTPALQGPPGVPGNAGDYVVITPSLSPYQMTGSSPWIFCDLRTGPVSLLLPTLANSSGVFFSVVNGYASANAITLTPPSAVSCWDPSTPGTYRTTSPLATIPSANGTPVRFKFSTTLSAWVPW
jgi:hypothetical protein